VLMSRDDDFADEGWVVLVEGRGRERATYLVGLATSPECEETVRKRYSSEPGVIIHAVSPLSRAALKVQKLRRGEVRPW
jgi:hypothetical protein